MLRRGGMFVLNKNNSAKFLTALFVTSAFTVPAFAQIETVVVTAERRSQDLQTVPVAVTAFTAADRQKIGIQTIQDMSNFTPGMSYSSSTDRVTIRGISRQTNVLSADSGVANYADGIYQSFAVLAGRSDLDLGRVEILRGPQGTLYGRNSIGGAINQISRRPDDTPTAEFRANLGGYNYSFLEGRVSAPISDDWKGAIYADWERQGRGWEKSIIPGRPEEGNVLNKWYVEGDIQATIGSQIDVWAQVSSIAWNNGAGDAGSGAYGWTPAGYPTYEYGGGLSLNPGYGCTAIPGATGFTADTTAIAATSPIGAAGCTNPAIKSPWKIAKLGAPTTTSVPGAYFGTTQITYHTNEDFDVKYIGGAEWYRYVLTLPGTTAGEFDAPISSLTISPNLNAGGVGAIPLTAIGLPSACAPAPSCPNFALQPQSFLNYQQQEFFTQNELNLQSTGNSALQWQGGVYSFYQHSSQPVSLSIPALNVVGATNNAIANPIYGPSLPTPAPEGGFILPHSPLGDRIFDNRPQFNDVSLAVYGQADYKLSDEFKLTGGLRYSYDRKYGQMDSRLVEFPGLVNPSTIVPPGPTTATPELLGGFDPAIDFTDSPNVINYTTSQATGDKGLLGFAQNPIFGGTRIPGFAHAKYGAQTSAVTGLVDLDYTPDETTLAYAKYSRGYKGGGFNTGILGYIQPKPFVPAEHVDAFEVGLKKTFGDWLLVDSAVYYYSYQDMQVPITVPPAAPGDLSTSQFVSIPRAVSEGFEAETILTPIENLTFMASYSYDEAHIQSSLVAGLGGKMIGIADPADPNAIVPGSNPLFTDAQCAAGINTTNPCGIDAYTLGVGGNGVPTGVDAGKGWIIPQSTKGNRLPNAPKNKIALNLRYDFHVADLGVLTPSLTYVWRSAQYGSIFTRFYNMSPSWDQYDSRISFASPDGKWNFIAFWKNIGNHIGYDTGAIGYRLAGQIDRSCAGQPLVGGGGVLALGRGCEFVQGETIAGRTNVPPGYSAVTNESAFGTVSTFSVNPPETWGIQIEFRL